jgi:hypothetical protein
LRSLDTDPEVQFEETRLVDAEALAALRGGLGESYRRSLLAILGEASAGLTFSEVVAALCARQAHKVHRGTVRAILYAGGFSLQSGRWFTAPDDEASARRLRKAVVQALLPDDEATAVSCPSDDGANFARLRDIARAIQARLTELIEALDPCAEKHHQG